MTLTMVYPVLALLMTNMCIGCTFIIHSLHHVPNVDERGPIRQIVSRPVQNVEAHFPTYDYTRNNRNLPVDLENGDQDLDRHKGAIQ